MTELRKVVVAKAMGAKTNSSGDISDVEKKTKDMNIIEQAMDTARKLAGTDALTEEMKRKEGKLEEERKATEKAEKELAKKESELVEERLGNKIDKLAELYGGGASKEKISDQIAEIKKAANEIGLGGGKVSEFKEMAELIKNLNPQKSLVEQLKDAKELIAAFQPEPGKEAHMEGMPTAIVLQVKKIDADLQIKLEEMRDDRQRRDQDFKLTLLKFEEDRDIRRQEVDGKILVERERNELISNALKTIGGAIGQGLKDGAAASPGSISRGPQTTGKIFQFEIPEGGFGTTECPSCHAPIEVGPTTTLAECLECKTQYPVIRTPAMKGHATPEPATEEE
jgi:hypothetical protein